MLDLEKTSAQEKEVAFYAVKDKKLLAELSEGLFSEKSALRYRNFKVIWLISNECPDALYGQWDFFENFLKSSDNTQKFYAIHVLANLAKVDRAGKFEGLFEDFYGVLNGDALIPACHVTYVSHKVVKAKPELMDKVTERLLNLDNAGYKHKELVVANAVSSFSEYFDKIKDKESN